MTPELPGKLATYESRLDAVAEQIHLGGVLADPLVGGVVQYVVVAFYQLGHLHTNAILLLDSRAADESFILAEQSLVSLSCHAMFWTEVQTWTKFANRLCHPNELYKAEQVHSGAGND